MISRILQKMGQNGVCGGIGISHGVVVICQLDLLDLLDILDLSVFQSLWENTAQRRDADGTSFPAGGMHAGPHRRGCRRYHGLAFTIRGLMKRFCRLISRHVPGVEGTDTA